MKPLFIVFEGIDGSGKSTQIDLLHQRLQPSMITHEPTDGILGQLLRKILRGEEVVDPKAFSAIYLADRLQHIMDPKVGMLQCLANGIHVIGSRYYFSTYAFQGEYVNMDWLADCNRECKSLLKADLTFYIKVRPEVSLERLRSSRPQLDIYENLAKLTTTDRYYMEAFQKYGADEDIVIIDGEASIESIATSIWASVSAKIHSAK